ncbi:Eukaryotic translation initiation factor 2A [Bulinus truncatus]|nr:Eukaryotic translation initiation factor 2A [Bulinus truncatus]
MSASVFLRGATGVWTIDGAKLSSEPTNIIEKSGTCKCMVFSEDGFLFAWCNAESISLMDTKTMKVIHEFKLPKTVALKFSPRASVLACWSNYTVNREEGSGIPNLHLLDVKSGTVKKSLIQKKQTNWDPEWSSDEGICVRNVNNELHFYEKNNFDTTTTKLHLQKVSSFSLAQSNPPYVIAAYVPGSKGQPSFARIYQYPNFAGPESLLANKSFFKADRVNFYWNKIGTCLLVLTSTESSDSSYYGEQALHFLSAKGESCFVPPEKKGPIYHVEWTPNHVEFIVIHGYMPAKTTVYNLKCEPVFDFGTGPRNLEFWDMKNKKLISKAQASDTTYIEWSPDGQHILTATTAPRLRVGNGFRIWHYSGTLMLQHFLPNHAELWQACWQPSPQVNEFTINVKPVESVVQQPKAQAAAYRPPHARNQDAPRPAPAPLHEYEPPSNVKKDADKPVSKNKKKRDARKAKAAQEDSDKPESATTATEEISSHSVEFTTTGVPEVDKKIRNLQKKVQQIHKLKEQQASGKEMEKNQLEKIKTLDSLLQEIKDLELGQD